MNADDSIGILAYGAYIPRLRLQKSAMLAATSWYAPHLKAFAKGERSMANWDEDTITMAVEASRDCLRDFNGEVNSVVLASTTAPFADRQNAGIVKEALDLPDEIATADIGGGLRAGTTALLNAFHAALAGNVSLCVASEKRGGRAASEAEFSNGDAAAGMLVGKGRPIARLLGTHSVSLDFVDHFRAAGAAHDYAWETRWVRDEGYMKIASGALRKALAKLSVEGSQVRHLIVPIVTSGVAASLANAAGIEASAIRDTLATQVGDTGTAQPLLMLAAALDDAQPGDKIVVLGYGQGVDVLVLEATAAIGHERRQRCVSRCLERRKPEQNYLKHLAFSGQLNLERGMRAEMDQKQPLTALFRNRRTVLGLVGGKCTKTGKVQYPRSEIAVGTADSERATFEPYRLADKPARIVTFTADSLGYSPDPPGYYGMVEFEGGGRMVCEFTDVDADAVQVGAPMRMMFRIKAVDERRDFTKYFWKAAPSGLGS